MVGFFLNLYYVIFFSHLEILMSAPLAVVQKNHLLLKNIIIIIGCADCN